MCLELVPTHLSSPDVKEDNLHLTPCSSFLSPAHKISKLAYTGKKNRIFNCISKLLRGRAPFCFPYFSPLCFLQKLEGSGRGSCHPGKPEDEGRLRGLKPHCLQHLKMMFGRYFSSHFPNWKTKAERAEGRVLSGHQGRPSEEGLPRMGLCAGAHGPSGRQRGEGRGEGPPIPAGLEAPKTLSKPLRAAEEPFHSADTIGGSIAARGPGNPPTAGRAGQSRLTSCFSTGCHPRRDVPPTSRNSQHLPRDSPVSKIPHS